MAQLIPTGVAVLYVKFWKQVKESWKTGLFWYVFLQPEFNCANLQQSKLLARKIILKHHTFNCNFICFMIGYIAEIRGIVSRTYVKIVSKVASCQIPGKRPVRSLPGCGHIKGYWRWCLGVVFYSLMFHSMPKDCCSFKVGLSSGNLGILEWAFSNLTPQHQLCQVDWAFCCLASLFFC